MKYSTFMNGLKKANIEVDRKVWPIWPSSISRLLPLWPHRPRHSSAPERKLDEKRRRKPPFCWWFLSQFCK
jgi:hypothetical protein